MHFKTWCIKVGYRIPIVTTYHITINHFIVQHCCLQNDSKYAKHRYQIEEELLYIIQLAGWQKIVVYRCPILSVHP